MAGRPRIVRNIQSYINHADANAGLGPLKAGFGPSVGVTHNYWYNYQSLCQPNRLAVPNYQGLVWLNIRPTYTPSPKKAYNNYGMTRYMSKQAYGKMSKYI
jgi:hypothetical protein